MVWSFAGFASIGASSEECDNYKNCRVVDSLWYHNMLRGVVILPKQSLALNKWMTFKNNLPSTLNPLYSATPIDIDSHIDQNTVYVLLETNIYPDLEAIENGVQVVSVSKKNFIFCEFPLINKMRRLFRCRPNNLENPSHGKSIQISPSFYNQTLHCSPN